LGSKEKLNTTTTSSEKNSMELMASFDRHSRRRSLANVAPVTPDGIAMFCSSRLHGLELATAMRDLPASIQTNSSALLQQGGLVGHYKIVLPLSRICASSATMARASARPR
jgi:hypothetical protein